MSFTDITCSYCKMSDRNSHRAFSIRLFPGNRYLIICDGCLTRERRYLVAEGPAQTGASSSTALDEESVRRLTDSIPKTVLAATHRLIKSVASPRVHDLPILSALFHSYKRFS